MMRSIKVNLDDKYNECVTLNIPKCRIISIEAINTMLKID